MCVERSGFPRLQWSIKKRAFLGLRRYTIDLEAHLPIIHVNAFERPKVRHISRSGNQQANSSLSVHVCDEICDPCLDGLFICDVDRIHEEFTLGRLSTREDRTKDPNRRPIKATYSIPQRTSECVMLAPMP